MFDDRVSRTVCVTVEHPPDWALEDVADELFDWSENIEDSRLVIHVVTGDQPEDLLLVESPEGETLEEWQVRMADLRARAEAVGEIGETGNVSSELAWECEA